jgi:plasmid stabilization system protein ParE
MNSCHTKSYRYLPRAFRQAVKIIWSDRAIAELGRIADSIEKDNPDAAERVASRIFHRMVSLCSMPERATPGRTSLTRASLVRLGIDPT